MLWEAVAVGLVDRLVEVDVETDGVMDELALVVADGDIDEDALLERESDAE